MFICHSEPACSRQASFRILKKINRCCPKDSTIGIPTELLRNEFSMTTRYLLILTRERILVFKKYVVFHLTQSSKLGTYSRFLFSLLGLRFCEDEKYFTVGNLPNGSVDWVLENFLMINII